MKLNSFIIFIFSSFVLLFVRSAYADDFETCVQNSLQSKQYATGLQCLRTAEQSSPKSYRIAYLFGVIFNASEQYDSAVIHLKRAIDLKDDYVAAYQELGNSYFQQKNYISAIGAYSNGMKNEGNNPSYTSLYDLGLAYALADSFKQGTFYLTKASEADKKKIEPIIALGDLYFRGAVYILAKEEYEAALGIEPKSLPLLEKLALTFYKNSEPDSSTQEFSTILLLNPNDTSALQNIAAIYTEQKKYSDARDEYRKLEKLDPVNFNYTYNDAVISYQLHDYTGAVEPLKKVIAARKDSFAIKAYQMLGESETYSKDYVGAVDAYKQFYAADSAAFAANDWKFYGNALLMSKDTAGAFSVFEAYSLKDTTDCTVTKLLGPEKMREQKYDDAIRFFKLRLLRCGDTNALSTYKNIGVCYGALNNPDSAILWYRRVLDKSPSDVYALLAIARTQYQSDEKDSALVSYQAFLDNAPKNTSASKQEVANGSEEAYKMIGVTSLINKHYENALENLKKALEINNGDCDAQLWTAQAYHNLQQMDDACKYYKEVVKLDCKNAKIAHDALKTIDCK